MKPKSSVFSLSTIDVVAGRVLMFYGPKWMRPPLTLSENCAKRWKHLPPWVSEREMNDTYWDNEKTHNKCQTSFRCSCVCMCAWLEISTFLWDKFEGMHSGFPKDICTRGFLSKPLPLYWLRYQKLGVESMALMAQYVLPLCTVKMKAIQASCESCCISSRGPWQWQARFLGGWFCIAKAQYQSSTIVNYTRQLIYVHPFIYLLAIVRFVILRSTKQQSITYSWSIRTATSRPYSLPGLVRPLHSAHLYCWGLSWLVWAKLDQKDIGVTWPALDVPYIWML